MARSPKRMTLAEIRDYKGNVIARWRAPRTKRQSVWALIRLLRFFYRARERKFLTVELLEGLQEFGRALMEKPEFAAYLLAYPELMAGYRELMKFELPRDLTEEIVEEKMRREEVAYCSVCGVRLVKPAYLVRRRGSEIVSISEPIGIRCLNGFKKKLKDLVVELRVEYEHGDRARVSRASAGRRGRSRGASQQTATQLSLF